MKKSGSTGRKPVSPRMKRLHVAWLMILCVGLLAAAGFQAGKPAGDPSAQATSAIAEPAAAPAHSSMVVRLFQPLVSDDYSMGEKIALGSLVFVALAGLVYALLLVEEVMSAPQGTKRMQEIAQAIREGANAYLYRQFSVVGRA